MPGMRRKLPSLEYRLLLNGVQRLAARREECTDCGRTPLVGERVHLYADGASVCTLCRSSHGGEPDRSELVRHSELGHAVKPAARIAA
jgi:hypothetical protein